MGLGGENDIPEVQILETGSVVLELHLLERFSMCTWILFFKVYFDCLYLCAHSVYLYEGMCVRVQVTLEAKRGCQIPFSWS